jgi:hypothetical protein
MSYWMPPKVGLDDAKCRAAADTNNSFYGSKLKENFEANVISNV